MHINSCRIGMFLNVLGQLKAPFEKEMSMHTKQPRIVTCVCMYMFVGPSYDGCHYRERENEERRDVRVEIEIDLVSMYFLCRGCHV